MKQNIVVTGISGEVGQVLLPYLESNRNINLVTGIDRTPLPDSHTYKKLRFHQMDIRDPDIETLIKGAQTAIHLAFKLMRSPGDREIEDINIRGTRNVLEAASRQKVKKLIILSSVVAYGLHADNPVPITEKSPLRPNAYLYYGRAKAANEAYLDEFQKRNPKMIVTRLRPCTIVGPKAATEMMASFLNPTAVMVKGYNPPYQLVHEDDVASALDMAIRKDLSGIFNVTSDNPRTLGELVNLRNGKITALPYSAARLLMGLLWLLGKSAFAPEWINLSRYPLIASNAKLKQAGWKPRYTTAQAYADLLASHGIKVSIPKEKK